MEAIEKIGNIDEMNLVALRKFACVKVNYMKDWYLKCIECQSSDDCKVGKRAIALLEKQTGSAPVGQKAAVAARIEKTREKARLLFEGTETPQDIVANLLKQEPDSKLVTVVSRLYTWNNSYPDISNGHPVKETARMMSVYMDRHPGAKVRDFAEYKKEEEVSIEEFLKEETVEVSTSKVVEPTLQVVTESPADKRDILLEMFSSKRKELRTQIEEVDKNLQDLTSRKERLANQLISLDEAAALFNMRPKQKI